MGFVLEPPQTYRLIFDGPLAGLEVVCQAGSFDEYEPISDLADRQDVASTAAMLEAFARVLVSWNIEEHDPPGDPDGPVVPVEASLASLRRLDFALALRIVRAWLDALGGDEVAPPQRTPDLDVESLLPVEAL